MHHSRTPIPSTPRRPWTRPLAAAPPLGPLLGLLFVLLLASAGAAQETVSVTVTNTSPQIVSPPILISHGADFLPLRPGAAASPELARLAEDGDASELAMVARVQPSVAGVAVADGPLMPGDSVTLEVPVDERAELLTLLGMLVTTNDAVLHWGGTRDAMQDGTNGDAMGDSMGGSMGAEALYDGVVRVFDAGSEANTEACAQIPGPPCGNAGARATDGAEGAIALHGGILGTGDLDPAEWDWLNPVATVTAGP